MATEFVSPPRGGGRKREMLSDCGGGWGGVPLSCSPALPLVLGMARCSHNTQGVNVHMLTVTDTVRANQYLAGIFDSFGEKLKLKYDPLPRI